MCRLQNCGASEMCSFLATQYIVTFCFFFVRLINTHTYLLITYRSPFVIGEIAAKWGD